MIGVSTAACLLLLLLVGVKSDDSAQPWGSEISSKWDDIWAKWQQKVSQVEGTIRELPSKIGAAFESAKDAVGLGGDGGIGQRIGKRLGHVGRRIGEKIGIKLDTAGQSFGETVDTTLERADDTVGKVLDTAREHVREMMADQSMYDDELDFDDDLVVVDIPSSSRRVIANPGKNNRGKGHGRGRHHETEPDSRSHTTDFGTGGFLHVPQLPDLETSFNPMNIFGFFGRRMEWWKGSNVCVDREEIEESESDDAREGILFSFQSTNCRDTESSHTCTTRFRAHGISKTFKVVYQCCHGYDRVEHGSGCESVNLLPLMDTIKDLGGGMFVNLATSIGLDQKLRLDNLTVFCPIDEAIKNYRDDIDDNVVVVEAPIMRRRSTDVGELVQNHLVRGMLRSGDFIDEKILITEGEGGGTIRTNVYHTPARVMMANCARMIKTNNLATNGVVHMVDRVITPVTRPVGDIITSDSQFTILKKLLSQAGMVKSLREEGQFTVFAPTDQAFRQMDPILLRKLLNGGGCIKSILKYHILPNVICSGAIPASARTQTLLDSDVRVRRTEDDKLFVNDAQIVGRDLMGTNGVVHIIDSVLIPEEANTITGILDDNQLTDLIELLDAADMRETVDSMQNVTFFAPINAAVQRAKPMLDELRKTPQKLKDVLMYHVAHPSTTVCEIDNNAQLRSALPGKNVRFNQFVASPFGLTHHITIQCARILEMDRKACGSTLQMIDKVLLPPAGQLVDVLAVNQSFSVMRRLLHQSGLERELLEHGPYTLLAPTDNAFYDLPEERLDDLLHNRQDATELIRHHIMPEVLCCAGVQQSYWMYSQKARTLSGSLLPLNKDQNGWVHVSSARITACDMMAENGVVHAINRVLFPQLPRRQDEYSQHEIRKDRGRGRGNTRRRPKQNSDEDLY